MLKGELIALGLREDAVPPVPAATAVATTLPNDPDAAALRMAIARLIELLLEIVAMADLTDDPGVRQQLESCRDAVVQAADDQQIGRTLDDCTAFCGRVLTEIGRQRVEQKKEMAGLVEMVREAMSIVSGDDFSADLDGSMQRIEALVQIEDVRLLKRRLVDEIGSLRTRAAERQRAWEKTSRMFTSKVDALERQLKITRLEASIDPLTHIASRGAFDRTLTEWMSRGMAQFVLAMVDIDNFKTINDTHGHGVGDRALVAVAQALQSAIRSQSDMVGRIGGDEFAVLIADLPSRQAENRLRMLNGALSSVSIGARGGVPVKLTLSVGMADRSAGDTVDSLKQRADEALYEAKRLGRNRIVIKTKPTLRDLLRG
jgi:diguanylate cyclase (GGDEF)-like protein